MRVREAYGGCAHREGVERTRLVTGLAVVFAGLTILLAVLAVILGEVFVVLVAAPFAVVTYFFWYQATGRLRENVRARHARGNGATGRGGFGAGPRRSWAPPGERRRRRRRRRAHAAYSHAQQARQDRRRATHGEGQNSRRTDSGGSVTSPTKAEAYRVLGVDSGADEAAVREAYRERVKDVHPDRGGDEAAFKRVTDAYERLTGE